MRWIIIDTEVFAYDWVIVAKEYREPGSWIIHNDYPQAKMLLDMEDVIFIGFNIKGYDRYILSAIYNNYSVSEIKEINDFIFTGKRPNLPWLDINIADVMDDMQMGTSLKSIEGHLGLSIEENSVSFDIDRPLTEEELKETIQYCTSDVNATEKVVEIRESYLNTKINLGKTIGLKDNESIYLTNALLTARYLGVNDNKICFEDEREYVLPENIDISLIPSDVIDFFKEVHNYENKDVFKSKLETKIGNCDTTFGWGGLHGAVNKLVLESSDELIIENVDVASYYPSLAIEYGYISRQIEYPERYRQTRDLRFEFKKNDEIDKSNDLKLILNTTYGATLAPFNPLYDPLQARSICITGQLMLAELAYKYLEQVPDVEVIQLNTDGMVITYHPEYKEKVKEVKDWWQKKNRLNLEEDLIKKIVQKDVNNYLVVLENGKIKTKGAYFKDGINTIGAFSINNNMSIVVKCLIDYFTKGITPRETIDQCNEILKYPIITKISYKYSECFMYINNEKVTLQKVNRVYATGDVRNSTLYKISKATGRPEKIPSLPDHCIIDNRNELSINDIDKEWYIALAEKKINEFIRKEDWNLFMTTKEVKKSTTKKVEEKVVEEQPEVIEKTIEEKQEENRKLNVYQKLIKARYLFLENNPKKTGKNFEIGFTYFSLENIIPTTTKVFYEVGLIGLFNWNADVAILEVVNTDKPEEKTLFTCPVVSAPTNKAIKEIQALGSTQTYIRRYLYMAAMDIVENDEVETPSLRNLMPETETTSVQLPVANMPVKPIATQVAAREEIKKELTKDSNNAEDELKTKLRSLMEEYVNLTEDKEKVDKILQQTNDLEKLTTSQAEIVIKQFELQIKSLKDDEDVPF